MPSVPSSPPTPSRKRRSLRLSSHEISQTSTVPTSSYASGTTNGTIFSRRSSRTSQTSFQQPSPITLRPISSRSQYSNLDRRKSMNRMSIGSNISLDQGSNAGVGLGNLADELEGAWYQDDMEDGGSSFLGELREGDMEIAVQSPMETVDDIHVYDEEDANNGHFESLHSPSGLTGSLQISPQKSKSHQQKPESLYDGSDYGPDSDDEDGSGMPFPPTLSKQIRDVEAVTRMSTNVDSLSEGGGVVTRTTHALKDLGPQTNIENGVSRLISAYASMTTHRSHKTRELFSNAHPLLYGGSLLHMPEDLIDDLIIELDSLTATVPFLSRRQHQNPVTNPLCALQSLATSTSDLFSTLRSLTDVLQEARHLSNTASRRLKSTREMVEEIQLEDELRETSIMLIQAGDWDRRCRERQAAQLCHEIVNGFGEMWSICPDGNA